MGTVGYTGRFKEDKRVKRRGKDVGILQTVIRKLARGGLLDPCFQLTITDQIP